MGNVMVQEYLLIEANERAELLAAQVIQLGGTCQMKADRISQLEAQLREREKECAEYKEWHPVDEWKARAESAEAALAAAREENERLREEAYLTYSYTCRDGHEETETLAIDEAIEAICEYRFRAENAESELAALRSRADDAGRVERSVKAIRKCALQVGVNPILFDEAAADSLARAVLAAADREGE